MNTLLKYCIYILGSVQLLFLLSCKNSNSPQAVAEGFVISYSKMDYESAKNFSTKETWDFLEVFEYYTKDLSSEEREKYEESKIRFRVIDQVKESDTSMVLTFSSEPQYLPFNQLRLVSHIDRNGREKWKVDINTISIIEGEDIYMLPKEAIMQEQLSQEGEAIIDTHSTELKIED